MTDINQLVEQHILQHESRLKHIDELLARAKKVAEQADEETKIRAELKDAKRDREELADRIQELKEASPEYWQKRALEKAGPMGVWDAVAQRLERLVERIEGDKKA